MNKQECIQSLMILEKWFPNFKVIEDKTLVDGWTKRLESYTPVKVKQAIELIIDNETYAPTPAVMKRYIEMISGNDSNEIVAIFKKAVSRYGSYQNEQAYKFIKSQSQIAYNLIMKIGFHSLCQMDQEKAIQKIHKEFRDQRAVLSDNVKAIETKEDKETQLKLQEQIENLKKGSVF